MQFRNVLFAALVCITMAVFVQAQPVPPAATPAQLDGPFQVSYANNPGSGALGLESYINMINTGANGASTLGPGLGGAVGNTCVNVYAFDPGEELIACCSCLLTPNQVVNFGINSGLLYKTQSQIVPSSVTIKLLNSLAGATGSGSSATACANSAYTVGQTQTGGQSFPIAAGLVAYVSTPGTANGTTWPFLLEHPFIPSTLSAGELASITGRCGSLIGNGSGYGICKGCTLGALGAAKL